MYVYFGFCGISIILFLVYLLGKLVKFLLIDEKKLLILFFLFDLNFFVFVFFCIFNFESGVDERLFIF